MDKRSWRSCGEKTRFDSEEKALRRGRKFGGQRAYECGLCKGWHLTSQATLSVPYFRPVEAQDAVRGKIARARRALVELDRKHVAGPFREAADAYLASLQGGLLPAVPVRMGLPPLLVRRTA